MNEKLLQYKDKTMNFWKERSKVQKGLIIGSVVSLVAILAIVSSFASKPNLVPLYSNLSLQETGQIQETLQAKGIQFDVANGGTTILVPEAVVDTLMVELAAEGIPDSGNIDYSFFGQNAGWAVTDKEFNVLKIEAMQTELSSLIKEIEGVEDARVMLNIPEPSVWMNEDANIASASIVLKQGIGYKFDQTQINALYHLVSKSVPNLPVDNIVIMNQMFEPFEIKNSKSNELDVSEAFATQYQIKKEIEKDIQQQVQQMLSMMMGPGKVVVSVTADLDFTKEKRKEERYETPNMEGIARSAEKITETFTGNGLVPGGETGTGETDVPNYVEADGANGDYEKLEERINYEVDKIYKEIDESPYNIRDLGIQVVVDPTTGTAEGEDGSIQPVMLDEAQQEELTNNIEQMLSTIIRTSISADQNVDNLNEKISITMQPFNGRAQFDTPNSQIPLWVYIVGGILLVVIIGAVILLVRRNRNKEEEVVDDFVEEQAASIPDVFDEKETEGGQRRKQLEKMAKEKPDEFAKLLRTWLAEE